tara:strand:- start:428 stop:775 length:348 start_codon:yes stop_codon:yes gene_type:complete
MTPLDINTLHNHLGLLGRTRKRIPFLFVPVSRSGSPLLHTDPEEIDAELYREFVLSAIDPRAVQGVVMRDDNGLFRFVVEKDTSSQRVMAFLRVVQHGMFGLVPSIQNASVEVEE